MNELLLKQLANQYGARVLRDLTKTLLNVTPMSTIEAHALLRRAIDNHEFAENEYLGVYASVGYHAELVRVKNIFQDDPVVNALITASSVIELQAGLLLKTYADTHTDENIKLYMRYADTLIQF